ncbi:hypothetical protein [Methylobacterium sp. OT2]|uniref:hypothetical protein n=1 Tax=Methylobacterium sp. OT2 TaxID=2813779 RepID=UPI00197C2288|nr:hypothetical protein [Methylobacterium sp. OT2]MBN4095639.1 hypothetical protein [Methylobacterium sp. OT2]
MKLVQLRIYSGDPETPGEAVYVAPDNVGMVESSMADPPASQVWLKVGVPMLLVEGSPETVAALIAEDGIRRAPPPPRPLFDPPRHRPDGVSWRA